jgi:hypothetical protein
MKTEFTLPQHLANMQTLSPAQKDQFMQQLGQQIGQLPPIEQLAQLSLLRAEVEQILAKLD